MTVQVQQDEEDDNKYMSEHLDAFRAAGLKCPPDYPLAPEFLVRTQHMTKRQKELAWYFCNLCAKRARDSMEKGEDPPSASTHDLLIKTNSQGNLRHCIVCGSVPFSVEICRQIIGLETLALQGQSVHRLRFNAEGQVAKMYGMDDRPRMIFSGNSFNGFVFAGWTCSWRPD